jgi:hypothetical protein
VALRIAKASGVKPRRPIRRGLRSAFLAWLTSAIWVSGSERWSG